MQLDPTRGLEYFKYRDVVSSAYFGACDAASRYFALDQCDQCGDLDKRLKSLEEHYDQLVFWRCEEMFDQLPPELVPTTNAELEELMQFLNSLNPLQPIPFKEV